jgi:MgtC family
MISPEQLVLELVLAAVLGGLVGLERERLEWAAGMRTHALVSLGSALFMVVSAFGFSDILHEHPHFSADHDATKTEDPSHSSRSRETSCMTLRSCPLAPSLLLFISRPRYQLLRTGTRSGWSASRPGLKTSFIPAAMTFLTNLATCLTCTSAHPSH